MNCRYYVAYTGVRLPFKFVNEITGEDLHLRNTYFRVFYDQANRLISCQKIVYGEVEFEHLYEYYSDGGLKRAEIKETDVDEISVVKFNEKGMVYV